MRRRRLLWNLYAALFLTVLFLATMLLGTWMRVRRTAPPAPQAYVAFLDVGDGDCALVRTVGGQTILIDAGSAQAGPQVVRILKSLHVRTIDLLVLASPSERSLGGVPAVLAAFPVGEAWDNAVAGGGEARRLALEAMRRRHIYGHVVQAGKKRQIDGATSWAVLWPPEHGPRARQDALICRMDFGATRFVFAGAATGEGAGALVAEDDDGPACDTGCSDLILQIPEGGATAGTAPEVLRRMAPSVAVISSGARPAPLTLHRLQAAGAEVHETDTMGTIFVATDGHGAPTITAMRL